MIDFGKALREAREAKGYDISKLSEITHILPQIIENLENEDFSRIVAPIYGRGFVKLYCETVGLDPKPFINEFMDIYNGNRPPTIRMRQATASVVQEPPPAPGPVMAPEPTMTPEPPPAPEPVMAPEPPPAPEQPAPPVTEPPPISEPNFTLPEPEPFEEPLEIPPKRDYRLPGYVKPEVPRRFWRFGILIAAAALIIALAIVGARAAYRATMTAPAEAPAAGAAESRETAVPTVPQAAEPAAERKPMSIPPLYID